MRGGSRAYVLQIGLRAIGLIAMAAFFAVAARTVSGDAFADYVVALAVYSIAVVLADFGLSQTAVVDLADPEGDPDHITGAVVRVLLVTTVLAVVVGGGIGLVVSPAVAFVLLVMAPSFLVSQAQVPFMVACQHRHAFVRVGVAEAGGRVIALVVLLAVIAAVGSVGVVWVVLASTVGVIFQFLVLLGPLPGSMAAGGGTVSLLKRSSSLGLTNAAAYLHVRVDQVLLAVLSTSLVVASYAVAYRVVDAALGLVSAVSVLGLPLLARSERTGRQEVARTLSSLLLVLASLGTMAAFLLAGPLVRVLGGQEYEGAASLLRALTPAIWIAVVNLVGALVLVAERRMVVLLWVGAITVLLNVGLNLLLIPRWDGAGAAAATGISELVGASVVGAAAARQLPGVYRGGQLVTCAAATAIGSVAVWGAWTAGLWPLALVALVGAVGSVVGVTGGVGALRRLLARSLQDSNGTATTGELDDPVVRDLA